MYAFVTYGLATDNCWQAIDDDLAADNGPAIHEDTNFGLVISPAITDGGLGITDDGLAISVNDPGIAGDGPADDDSPVIDGLIKLEIKKNILSYEDTDFGLVAITDGGLGVLTDDGPAISVNDPGIADDGPADDDSPVIDGLIKLDKIKKTFSLMMRTLTSA